jgi:hypothetical protein
MERLVGLAFSITLLAILLWEDKMSDKVQDPTITACKTKPAEERVDKAKDGYIAKVLAGKLKDPPLQLKRKILKALGMGENDGI